MEPDAFFSLPLWRDYTFQIVLAGTTILGVLCGVVGSFIVLRREALLGDGISHSSYPGIMLAFLFLGVKTLEGLLLGAFLSAFAALSLILLARHYTKLPFDGVLASILSSFFGAGLVLSSIIQHTGNANQSGLNQFIRTGIHYSLPRRPSHRNHFYFYPFPDFPFQKRTETYGF